jgi:ParB family chromosome partitioning protein
MNPADEYVAMAALVDAGQPVETIAARFDVSERHVRQRLRLGKVAPELLDAFRAGAFSFDALIAFTIAADHAAQRAAWRQLTERHSCNITACEVRRHLTGHAVPLHSPIATFVGVAAYEAAGGTIMRDPFGRDDDGFLRDAALVRRLTIEKLEAKAEELRSQWAWAKAVFDPEYDFRRQYGQLRPQPGVLPPALTAELTGIEERLGALEGIDWDGWTDDLMAEADQLRERRDEIDEIANGLAFYTDEDRACSGCIVTIGKDGNFCLYQGLIDRSLADPVHKLSAKGMAGLFERGGEIEDNAFQQDLVAVSDPERIRARRRIDQ